MLFERPRRSESSSTGDPTTLGEVWAADLDAGRYAGNVNSGVRATEEAYDARIDAVAKATGVRLVNPFRSPVGSTGGAFGLDQDTGDPFAFFEAELSRLAENRPEFRDIIAPDRSPRQDALAKARRVDEAAGDVYGRAGSGALPVRFAAGFRASLEDPANLLTMMLGPTGRVGSGAREVLWMGVKSGAANAAVETALQPVIQDWRRQAGLDYGASHAAMNIATAGLLGFGLDAGIRSGFRGVQAARGQMPILDKDGKVTGYKPAGAHGEAAGGQTQPGAATLPADPETALDAAARAAPDGSLLRRAADGDRAALDELTAALGIADDPAVRGARQAMQFEAGEWRAAGVLDEDGYDQMIAALRHAENPDAHPPARGADQVPDAKGERISDDADAGPLGRAFEKDGKPVTFRAFDPQKIAADPETFQFRRQVNRAGTTGRMSNIERWDPMASGKIVAFERLDGEIVIADGHHRLELAQRLAEQKPELTGYLFRERDGWTTADVRAYAAKKNMMDSPRVDPIDAASALRERPDLIDKSVAVGDEAMRQARALAKLSDEAFGMTVGGVLPPNMAALIGDLAPDKSRHASLMAELASIEPANIREARFALAEIMALPVHVEEQLTLLGGWKIERSLMKERMGVLDAALKLLRDDKRVFGLLEREAERIAGAGNRLDAAGNAARADSAGQVAALIESLAVQRGPVSDWLTDAARAVASGDFSKRQSAQAFVKRIADTYETGGLAALTRAETPLRAGGFDEPMGPEAQAQVKALEQQFGREIEVATKPDKARERESTLLDATNSIRSARTMEQWEEIGQELRRTIQMLPPDVKLRVEERIVFPETGGEVAGMWDGYERLVYVSLAAGDPVRTARHEVVHALRQSGLLSDAEFDTLYRFADKLGLRQAYQIDELYKANYTKAYGDRGADAVEALLREETIANMFSDYSLNGRRFGDVQGGGVIDKMIDEIVSFLKEIRDFLGVRGFRDVTDVFEAIESGAVARRNASAGVGAKLASLRGDDGLLPWGGKRHLVQGDPFTAADAVQRVARDEISLPSAADLETAANRVRTGEQDLLTAAFGGSVEKAKRWQHLWRQAEHYGNGPRAEKADAERAAMEADVTDRSVFDGVEIGDEPTLRDLASVFRDIENNPTEIPDILPRHLSHLPLSDKSPLAWTIQEAKAVAIMRKAGFEMVAHDLDVRAITAQLLDRYARYFSDPKDAQFMVEALRASIVPRPREQLRAGLIAAERIGDAGDVVANCKG